jgi:hypothetical protein
MQAGKDAFGVADGVVHDLRGRKDLADQAGGLHHE